LCYDCFGNGVEYASSHDAPNQQVHAERVEEQPAGHGVDASYNNANQPTHVIYVREQPAGRGMYCLL